MFFFVHLKRPLRSSQDLSLGLLNSGQMLLPTEPLELLVLEQRIAFPRTDLSLTSDSVLTMQSQSLPEIQAESNKYSYHLS